MKIVQERLGHSSFAVTADTYQSCCKVSRLTRRTKWISSSRMYLDEHPKVHFQVHSSVPEPGHVDLTRKKQSEMLQDVFSARRHDDSCS